MDKLDRIQESLDSYIRCLPLSYLNPVTEENDNEDEAKVKKDGAIVKNEEEEEEEKEEEKKKKTEEENTNTTAQEEVIGQRQKKEEVDNHHNDNTTYQGVYQPPQGYDSDHQCRTRRSGQAKKKRKQQQVEKEKREDGKDAEPEKQDEEEQMGIILEPNDLTNYTSILKELGDREQTMPIFEEGTAVGKIDGSSCWCVSVTYRGFVGKGVGQGKKIARQAASKDVLGKLKTADVLPSGSS